MGLAFLMSCTGKPHEGSSKTKLLIMQILTALLLLLQAMCSHAFKVLLSSTQS